jgi:hypothetical protein
MTTLEGWVTNGWLKRHVTSPREIADLLAVARREMAFAKAVSHGVESGEEGEFSHSYEAARTLAKIALHACGYTTSKGSGTHYYSFESLRLTLGLESKKVVYLHTCTKKRGTSLYDRTGTISKREARDLLNFTKELLEIVLKWLNATRPELMPGTS